MEGNCRLKKLLYYELALVNLNGENATCKSAPEIRDLAQEILSPEKFEEAFRIAVMLKRDKKSQREAIAHLRAMVRPPPTRPLYYVQDEIGKLRSAPRNCIRYLGDYIDLLTKAMAFGNMLEIKL